MHPRAPPLHRTSAAAAAAIVGQKPLHLGEPRFWSATNPVEKAPEVVLASAEDDDVADASALLAEAAAKSSPSATLITAVVATPAPAAQGKRKRAIDEEKQEKRAAVGESHARTRSGAGGNAPTPAKAEPVEPYQPPLSSKKQVSAAVASLAAQPVAIVMPVPAAASVAAVQPEPSVFVDGAESDDSEGELPEIDSGSSGSDSE